MQKLLFHFILALFLPRLAFAQPVLDASSLNQIGDQIQLQPCYATTVGEGTAGANQTWNFSALQPKPDGNFTIYYLDPAQTPNANLFPFANLATEYTDLEGHVAYAYFNQNGSEYWFLGATYEENIQSMSEPDLLARLPMNFGQTTTSSYLGEQNFGTFQSAIYGTKTMLYDGYGSITLPGGVSYPNAIRTKTTEIQTDSVTSFEGGFYTLDRSNIVAYAWFVPGVRSAVLEIRYTSVTSYTYIPGLPIQETIQPAQKTVTYQVNPTSGTDAPAENRIALHLVSANPCTGGQLLLETDASDHLPLTLCLYSHDGKQISNQQSTSGQFAFDMDHLPAGTYRVGAPTNQKSNVSPISIVKI
jgi:hypothetical protein